MVEGILKTELNCYKTCHFQNDKGTDKTGKSKKRESAGNVFLASPSSFISESPWITPKAKHIYILTKIEDLQCFKDFSFLTRGPFMKSYLLEYPLFF